MSAIWHQLFVTQLQRIFARLPLTALSDEQIDANHNDIKKFKVIACIALIIRMNAEFYKNANISTDLDMNTVLNGNLSLDLLLIRRALNIKDIYGGDVAFPGGKFEVQDRKYKNSVEREVSEEIGIDLRNISNYKYLGTLPSFEGFSYIGKLKVLPFVYLQAMDFRPTFALNSSEIRDVFWMNLSQIARISLVRNMQEFKEIWNKKYSNVRKDNYNCCNISDDGCICMFENINLYSWQFIVHKDKDFQLFLKRTHGISSHLSLRMKYKLNSMEVIPVMFEVIVIYSKEFEEYSFLYGGTCIYLSIFMDVLQITHFMWRYFKIENIEQKRIVENSLEDKINWKKIHNVIKQSKLLSAKIIVDCEIYPYFYNGEEEEEELLSKL